MPAEPEGLEASSTIQKMSVACRYVFRSGVDRWCSVRKCAKMRCVVAGVNAGQHRAESCYRLAGHWDHGWFLVALWPAVQVEWR